MSFKAYNAGFRRLIDRFGLKTLIREDVVMLSQIRPVTNIDDLKKTYVAEEASVFVFTHVSGSGNYTGATVPAGKRYHIFAITFQRTIGDALIETLSIRSRTAGSAVPIKVTAAAANLNVFPSDIPGGTIVDEHTDLIVSITAGTIDTSWSVRVHAAVEDIF